MLVLVVDRHSSPQCPPTPNRELNLRALGLRASGLGFRVEG